MSYLSFDHVSDMMLDTSHGFLYHKNIFLSFVHRRLTISQLSQLLCPLLAEKLLKPVCIQQ